MRLILIASLCLAAAACSRGDQQRLSQDARSTSHDTVVALRKGAAEAEYKGGQALINAGEDAKRAARQAHADSSGDHSQDSNSSNSRSD